MYYIFESLFVGLYSFILFFLISNLKFKLNLKLKFTMLLFITGFIKHTLGYMLQLWKYFCNYGYTCKKLHIPNKSYVAKITPYMLLFESIIEGIVFVIIGSIISLFIKNKLYNVFIIGLVLHILSSLLYIHSNFCISKCVTNV
jgi:hypothetical protein